MLSFTRLRRYGILFAHSMKEATFLWFLMQKFREAKLIWTNLLWFVVVFKVSQWLHLDESAQKSAKMNACLQIHVSVGCSSTGTRPRNHFPTWNPLKDFDPTLPILSWSIFLGPAGAFALPSSSRPCSRIWTGPAGLVTFPTARFEQMKCHLGCRYPPLGLKISLEVCVAKLPPPFFPHCRQLCQQNSRLSKGQRSGLLGFETGSQNKKDPAAGMAGWLDLDGLLSIRSEPCSLRTS